MMLYLFSCHTPMGWRWAICINKNCPQNQLVPYDKLWRETLIGAFVPHNFYVWSVICGSRTAQGRAAAGRAWMSGRATRGKHAVVVMQPQPSSASLFWWRYQGGSGSRRRHGRASLSHLITSLHSTSSGNHQAGGLIDWVKFHVREVGEGGGCCGRGGHGDEDVYVASRRHRRMPFIADTA